MWGDDVHLSRSCHESRSWALAEPGALAADASDPQVPVAQLRVWLFAEIQSYLFPAFGPSRAGRDQGT